MKNYFVDSGPEAKVIAWGEDSKMPESAVPVVIFPPAVSDDFVNDVLAMLITNPNYEKEGEKVEDFITASLKEFEESLSNMGAPPDTLFGVDPPQE